MMSRPIEFGIMTNLHHTTYAEVRSIWQTAEREGLDHAWTPDHLLPAFSDPRRRHPGGLDDADRAPL